MKINYKIIILISIYTFVTLIFLLGIPVITKQTSKSENYIELQAKESAPYSIEDKTAFLVNKYQDLNYNSYNLIADKYLVFNTNNDNLIINIYNNKIKTINDLFINNDFSPAEALIQNEIKKKYPEFISAKALAPDIKRSYAINDDIVVTFKDVKTDPLYDKSIYVILSCSMIKDMIDYKCQETTDSTNLNITHFDKSIALTFDDGPSKNTAGILQTLKANHAHATFFMLGSKMADNSDLIKTILSEGNQIGGHSYSHKYLSEISDKVLEKEMNKSNEAYKAITGLDLELVRPPYGSINTKVKDQYNYSYILWSIDTNDWKHKDTNKTIAGVLDNPQNGDIALIHDTYSSSAEALKQILPELYIRGFNVVTVSELAASQNQTIEKHTIYRSFK